MSLDIINEAFKRLEFLDEDVFDLTSEGMRNLRNFIDQDDDTEIISVIDPEAKSSDELQDSYMGKIILDCNICHSLVFKNKEDLDIDAEGIVNHEENCPRCGEIEGFTIIGQVSPYSDSTEDENVPVTEPETPVETKESEEELAESVNTHKHYKPTTMRLLKLIEKEPLEEGFNNVSIETDDSKMTMTSDESGKVTVTTEPLPNDSESELATEEVISPLSDEEQADLMVSATETSAEEAPEETTEETADIDIEEIDEESLDELGESYMKSVYGNIDSFKTSDASCTSDKLIVEGVITFKSGATKKTGFIFEAKDMTADGKLTFNGRNTHFSRGNKSFALSGRLHEGKLIAESLTYNYRAKTPNGKSKRVYGTVSSKK